MANNQNQKQGKKSSNESDILQNPGTVPDIVDGLQVTCFELAREYINTLEDPETIKENNGLFVDMLKYIYNNYLVDILRNNTNRYANRYDYKVLDKIFNIYTSLVYRYKQNKRCSILEFTIFIRIDYNSLYNAINNNTKKLTSEDIENVKRWFKECENSLTNGSGVFEIFLLKSQYRYNDNLAPVPIESQGSPLSVADLPDLSEGVAKIANNPQNGPQKDG